MRHLSSNNNSVIVFFLSTCLWLMFAFTIPSAYDVSDSSGFASWFNNARAKRWWWRHLSGTKSRTRASSVASPPDCCLRGPQFR